MNITGKYSTKHGELIITQDGDSITANYQESGTCTGKLNGSKVEGTWKNKEGEGRFEWTFDGKGSFTGKYKNGLEAGGMRGKWDGQLIGAETNTASSTEGNLSEDQKKWIDKKDLWDYEKAPKAWLNSKEFMMQALKKDGYILEYASDKFKDDKEIVLCAISIDGGVVQFASDKLKEDDEIVLAAITNDGSALEYVNEKYRNDRKIVLTAVSNYGRSLEFVSDQFKDDKEIVLKAVSNGGLALEYASDKLKNDKEIVLAAVSQYGYSLSYAPDNFKDDREIVLTAVTNYGSALEYASQNLMNDKEILLAAVSKDSKMLKFANEDFKKDKEILTAAIKHNDKLSYLLNDQLSEEQKQCLEEGITLEDFDEEYQGGDDGKVEWMKEKAFLMEAVKHEPRILKHASAELKADRELVLEAIKEDIKAIEYADQKLQSDPEILISRIITFFEGNENISITDDDLNAFIVLGDSYDPMDIIEKFLFKVEFIVLKNRKEEFHSFYKKIIDFVNKNHECFWILQAVSARLETIESNASWYEENPDHYTNVCELTQSFDIELEFEPSIEFETYFNDSEINSSWDDCKWTSSEDEEGLHFSEFIMEKTDMEWDAESWSDIKFYNHAISRIWVGLINYSLRYLHEGFDEENGAICLHSVVQEYYEPIQDSGNADYGINTFRIIAEYLLEIPQNDYDLNETDRDDLEEFNGWQFDLNKVAHNMFNRDLFDCEFPEPSKYAKEKQ